MGVRICVCVYVCVLRGGGAFTRNVMFATDMREWMRKCGCLWMSVMPLYVCPLLYVGMNSLLYMLSHSPRNKFSCVSETVMEVLVVFVLFQQQWFSDLVRQVTVLS